MDTQSLLARWGQGCCNRSFCALCGALLSDFRTAVLVSDTHQLSTYLENYHAGLDSQISPVEKGTEIYVPRHTLGGFFDDARREFRQNGVPIIYGTVRLIDIAINHKGSYYLTYHRFATRAQVQACYPQFAEFLRLKRRYDPDERFQSDWYRHYAALFA